MINKTTQIKKIADYKQQLRIEKCGFISNRNGVNVIKRTEMYDWFRKNGHLFFKDNFKCVSNALYGWNGKYWETGGGFIDKYIYNQFDKLYDVAVHLDDLPYIRKIAQLKDNIPEESYWSWDEYTEKVYVTFKNGTLTVDLVRRDYEFKPDAFEIQYNAVYMLHCEFEDEMMQPEYWENSFVGDYLKNFYDEYCLDQLQQFLASILIPRYQPQQALIIYGEGGDGKGVLMGTLKKLFGKVVTELDPSKWSGSHDTARLVGSVLNITNEAPSREISIDIWKSIVANDAIDINPKFESRFSYTPYTKHIMTVNELPKVVLQKATVRRSPTIKTCKSTDPADRSILFKDKFEQNSDALVSFMLHGLYKLEENNFKEIIGSVEMREEFIYENESTIADFIDKCVLVTGDKDKDFTSAEKLFRVFTEWKHSNGQGSKDITKNTFGKKVKNVLMARNQKVDSTTTKRVNGVSTRGFEGLALSKEGKKLFNAYQDAIENYDEM